MRCVRAFQPTTTRMASATQCGAKHSCLRGSIINEDCVAVVIERPVVNIDDQLDLRMARMLSLDLPSEEAAVNEPE